MILFSHWPGLPTQGRKRKRRWRQRKKGGGEPYLTCDGEGGPWPFYPQFGNRTLVTCRLRWSDSIVTSRTNTQAWALTDVKPCEVKMTLSLSLLLFLPCPNHGDEVDDKMNWERKWWNCSQMNKWVDWLRFIENFSLSYFPLYGLPYYEIPPEWAVHHHSERKLFLIQIFIPIKPPDHISFSYVSDYMCLYIPNMHHNQTTWSQMVKIRLAAVSSKFEVVCKIVQHICLNSGCFDQFACYAYSAYSAYSA